MGSVLGISKPKQQAAAPPTQDQTPKPTAVDTAASDAADAAKGTKQRRSRQASASQVGRAGVSVMSAPSTRSGISIRG